MSSAARIEELQKKFDENPRRYFAPLANECRKAGELDAAIAICRAHLPQQPGHMSGHIVYGQALFESGDLVEARTVFETALGLDPENLIALRHMGDIAARNGNLVEARQWYMRVLETDPRNEEIQALVAGLGDGASDAGAALDGLPSLLDPALVAAAADAAPDDASPFAGAGSDLVPTSFDDATDAGAAEGFSLDGFEATSFEAPPGDASASAAAVDLEFDVPDERETAAMPHGSLDGLEPTAAASVDATAPSGPAADYPDIELLEDDRTAPGPAGRDFAETIAAPTFELEAADDTPLQDPPPPPTSSDAFVTETMAELYLRQGYADQALAVYRQLVAQSPDDAGLRERMERVEADLATGGNADAEATVPGLPRAMEPALVAAAAEAGEGDRSGAGASAGPTIREYLMALAAGQALQDAGAVSTSAAAYGEYEELDTSEPEPLGGEDAASSPVVPPVAGFDLTEVDVGVGTSAPDAEPVTGTGTGAEPEENARESAAAAPGDQRTVAGGLDSLFAGEASSADVSAADSLASAYLPTPSEAQPGQPADPAPAADPLSGRPARPAGSDLSLDHVFGTPRQPGAARNTGGFSFDQFFAEGAVTPPRDDAAEPGSNAADEEDLEQFNSWLHNLKNQ